MEQVTRARRQGNRSTQMQHSPVDNPHIGSGLPLGRVGAILGQEHWCHGHRWSDLRHKMRRKGIGVLGAQAVSTDADRPSAGVLVAAPSQIGLTPPPPGTTGDFSRMGRLGDSLPRGSTRA